MKKPYLPEKEVYTEEELQAQEKEFRTQLKELQKKAEEFGVNLRLTGSMAVRLQTPEFSYIAYDNNRALADFDFVIYKKDIIKLQDMFFSLQWEENQTVLRLFGDKRRIFHHPLEEDFHADVFIDKLRFCHEIDLRKRLEIEDSTLSLIDLLLAKVQIVEINKKDLLDTMQLLRKYPLSDEDVSGEIYIERLVNLCCGDWGWWRTVSMNLEKVIQFSNEFLSGEDSKIVRQKTEEIQRMIDESAKSLKWKIRKITGDKIKWYNEVEEVRR